MDDDKKQDNIIDKIDKQIENIEEKITSLLEDIDLEMITPVDKMELAIKFMAQYAKFLALKKSIELRVPKGRDGVLMSIWMDQMRGEKMDG